WHSTGTSGLVPSISSSSTICSALVSTIFRVETTCCPSTTRQTRRSYGLIAVSREDPKFLRVDDAEIVGDGRRELVEPLWHGFAQEAEHGFGKVAEFGVAFVVGDVLVHHFPQPFDRVEMRAV